MRHRNIPFLRLALPLVALGLAPAALAVRATAGLSVKSYSSISAPYTWEYFYQDGPYDTGSEAYFHEGGFGYSAVVTASSYGLHGYNDASMETNSASSADPVTDTLSSSSVATIAFDDCIVTGTATVPVRTRIAMLFEGGATANSLLTSTPRPDVADVSAAASATIRLTANGKSILPDSQVFVASRNGVHSGGAFGALEGFLGKMVVYSDYFTVVPNQPFSVQFGLSTQASVGSNSASRGTAYAAADFANTYSFAIDRPVFELPEGYTMNSVSGHIADNRFVPQAVPEPGTFAALGAGALAVLRRRRKA